jgi:hypothetical protein
VPFTIPNHAAAFSAFQASPDSVDFDILTAAFQGEGVVAGCAVTSNSNMTVAIAAGIVAVNGVRASVTGANSTIGTADTTNPRIDLITVNSSGTIATTAGTAAAVPLLPSIPSTSVVLAMIYVPVDDTVIATNQITDKRVFVNNAAAPGLADDNIVVQLGTGADAALVLRSTALSADAELAGVIVGTSDHPGVAANSLIVSNITADGDMMFIVQTGGNSNLSLLMDASASTFAFQGGNVTIANDLTVTGGDIVLGTTSIFSGGDTTSLNNIDAIDATTEATIEGAIDTLSSLTTTGALNAGSITSGFGTINTGSSTITTTGLISGGSLDIDNVLIDGTTIGHTCDSDLLTLGNATLLAKGTVTVGVDDTGHDVKFFGASAGAFLLYNESCDLLEIRGATAAGPGHLKLTTGEATVVACDVLGKIEFQAPAECGTDAIVAGASIQAVAQATFTASVNNTDLLFLTGLSGAATEKFRITANGELGVGGANYGSDGHVLTSTGCGTAPAWEALPASPITAINCFTANELVTVGGTTTELCGEANLFYDATTLTLQKNSGRPVLDLAGYANGPNASGLLRLRHSGNTTPGCHTAVAAGEQLGEIRFCGSNGSAFATGVTIYALSNQTWSGSAGGTRLEFRVTADCATSPVSRMTLENCGNLSLDNNDLLNVGASTNDWTDGGIFTAGVVDLNNGANSAIMTVETESTNNVAQIKIITGAGSTQVNDILFVQGSGNGAADNMGWNLGYLSAGPYFRLRSNDNNGSSGDGCIWRVHDGGEEMLLAANHGSNFDKYDDALVLERHFSDPYRVGETLIKESQNELIEMGVLVEGSDGWIGQSINRWVPLLAGGIYQTRFTLDKNHECHEARLKALEAKIG